MPVPFRMIPPRGAVTALSVVFWGLGTPRYCTVVLVVVAVMSVWALALNVANAIRITKQNQTLGEVNCAHTAAAAGVRVEDLIFVPSCPEA